jgi:3',5'-cyclic-nucleotide phosphodiesterase
VLRAERELSALIMEVAFPNDQHALAKASCHHTPESLEQELKKLGTGKRDLPVLLFHIKPVFQRTVERELSKIRSRNNTILEIGDEYVL